MRVKKTDDRALLLQAIEETYNKPNWNETNLRSSIRRLSPGKAGWIPPHSKHNIAAIVLHCAYWKYALRRKLRGDKRGGFPHKGSNWFAVEQPLTRGAWTDYVAIIDDQHLQLCDAILEFDKQLAYSKTSSHPLIQRIVGLVIHDAYHTGQIHLIKAMYNRSHRS